MRHAKKISAGVAAAALAIATPMIEHFEGSSNTAYQDQVGVWTVCSGITAEVKKGDHYTDYQCRKMNKAEVGKVQRQVINAIDVPLNKNQLAAIDSLTYNIGIGNFRGSTLLVDLNNGNFEAVADDILDWTYAGGKYNPGLHNRRVGERRVFLTNP